MSPIPTVLPHTRARIEQHVPADRLTLLAEQLMALAESIRQMAQALLRAGRTVARVTWFYNAARHGSRRRDLENAVLDAMTEPVPSPVLHRPTTLCPYGHGIQFVVRVEVGRPSTLACGCQDASALISARAWQ